MSYVSQIGNVIYYVLLPIIYILQTFLAVILVILSPVLYLGQFIIAACTYPLRFIPKLETLYIFIGVAVIVGALTGTSLHYVSSFILAILGVEREPRKSDSTGPETKAVGGSETEPDERPFVESVEDFGFPSESPKSGSDLMSWDWVKREQGKSGEGKIPNTILEEDDSSDFDFGR